MGDIDDVRALLAAEERPVGWPARRARLDQVGSVIPPAPDVVIAATTLGGVPIEESLAPGADTGRVLLVLHGGGYCSGSIRSHRRLATEAGRASGARAVAVGYRLAPEHPYPAALDDVLSVWRILRESGVDAASIAVAGDSAGGGLAVALWQRLREAGEAGPACLWLMSPWTDLTLGGESLTSKDGVDPLIHRGYLDELASAYAPDRGLRSDPHVSPLFADLAGLPPTLIQVGSDETLLDDSVRFARAAGGADARVTLEIWPHMIHAFPLWNGMLDAGREAIAHAGGFVREHLHRQ